MATPGQGRHTDVQIRLMKAFEAKPGTVLYADDLAEELDVYRDTVQAGVNNLRRKPDWDEAIEIVVRGQAWKYTGPGAKATAQPSVTGLSITVLAATETGDLILQGSNGKVYRAKELS